MYEFMWVIILGMIVAGVFFYPWMIVVAIVLAFIMLLFS